MGESSIVNPKKKNNEKQKVKAIAFCSGAISFYYQYKLSRNLNITKNNQRLLYTFCGLTFLLSYGMVYIGLKNIYQV